MINPIFRSYKEIRDQIKTLEGVLKEFELQIMDQIDQNQGKPIETEFGKFTYLSRKSWKYSEKVKELSEAVTNQKKLEELDGTALLERVSGYIRLDSIKEENER